MHINNEVFVTGRVISGVVFNHEVFGEKFYKIILEVNRSNEKTDHIPLMVSERLLDVSKDYRGRIMNVVGQFRSFNFHDRKKSHLILSVFATDINFPSNAICTSKNRIYLEGYTCKETIYRKTPLGREITDILLAVNRPYGKTDYIPCIAWGRNARYASYFPVSTHVRMQGRIQSREYTKKVNETEYERKIAYEISVLKMEVIDNENNKA